MCCDISAGLIRQTDLYGTCFMGLLFDMPLFDISNPHSSVSHYATEFASRLYVRYEIQIILTWDTPQSIQQNGAVVCNNVNLAQLQSQLNMYYQ